MGCYKVRIKKESKTSCMTGYGYRNALSKIKLYFGRQRLGQLLVSHNKISPTDLKRALKLQRQTNMPLGRVLLVNQIVTKKTLYSTLLQQATIRCLAGACAFVIMATGLDMRTAHANSYEKDTSLSLTFASTNVAGGEVAKYPVPKIFGADGQKFTDVSAFIKWQDMFDNFQQALQTQQGQDMINTWKTDLKQFEGMDVLEMAKAVNDVMNQKPYIEDIDNWEKTDYWANPVEFNKRGGDCEDFAIAKYVALRALGVPESSLRLAVVHDMQRDMPHAVLVVLSKGQSYVLDNQYKTVRDTAATTRYFPIYSINQQAWWFHNDPADMALVTASR